MSWLAWFTMSKCCYRSESPWMVYRVSLPPSIRHCSLAHCPMIHRYSATGGGSLRLQPRSTVGGGGEDLGRAPKLNSDISGKNLMLSTSGAVLLRFTSHLYIPVPVWECQAPPGFGLTLPDHLTCGWCFLMHPVDCWVWNHLAHTSGMAKANVTCWCSGKLIALLSAFLILWHFLL